MVLALTTQNKVLLGGMAAIFIVFALVSAFLVPRYRPDYPTSRGLWPFVIASIVLFAGMMLAVELFAVEEEEGEAHAAAGGSVRIEVSAPVVEVAAHDFRFELASTPESPDAYTFELANEGDSPHNLVVERPGVSREATAVIQPGESSELNVDLRRGEYVLYCSVAGHREAGMEETLKIE